MGDQDKILHFLKVTGPTTPSKVAKNIGQSSIIASAYLSDLKSQGKLKISNLKIGSTPLYYLEGQENLLFDFAEGNINPKDFIVLEELKKQKILRENDLELLGRIALRKLKDFAIPLHVSVKGKKELFWKWHLLPAEEANSMIKNVFFKDEKKIPVKEQPIEKVEPIKVDKKEIIETVEPEVTKKENKKEIEKEQKTEEKKGNEVSKKIEEKKIIKKTDEKEEPKKVEVAKSTKKKEEESKEEDKKEEDKKEEVPEKKTVKKKVIKTKPKTKKQTVLVEKESESVKKESEKPSVIQKDKEKIVPKKRKISHDEFLPAINGFFQNLEIKIDQRETVRKNTELNFYIIVPSVVGKIKYFCKAKKKNRCDEKDLSAAYMEAQSKKLPLLFLYTNEMNKKAEEMLESGAFENVVVRRIE